MCSSKFGNDTCGGCSCHTGVAPCNHCVNHSCCPECGLLEDECVCNDIKNNPHNVIKCECGADKCGSPGHSTWCPKYKS